MQTVSNLQSKQPAGSRYIQNQIQNQNQGRSVSFGNGVRASEQAAVVAGYVVAATDAGIIIEGRARAIIAGQAGKLLDEGWRVEEILRAVDRFARRRRFAGHLAQWCRENAMDERECAHEARKRADPRDGGLRQLARAMKEIGL